MQSTAGPASVPSFSIRAGTPEDRGFIAQCWVREFRESSGRLKHVDATLFNRYLYPRVAVILEDAEVRIAGPKGDDVTVYGFAVLGPGLVHMVYVRQPWRRFGIAKTLLSGVPLEDMEWTTETRDQRDWIRHKHRFRGHRPFWMTEVNHGRDSEVVAERTGQPSRV